MLLSLCLKLQYLFNALFLQLSPPSSSNKESVPVTPNFQENKQTLSLNVLVHFCTPSSNYVLPSPISYRATSNPMVSVVKLLNQPKPATKALSQ